MTHEDFQKVLERRQRLSIVVLGTKAGEYASKGDRLHNFHHAAEMTRVTPEEALLGMLSKHLVSVVDMVKDTSRSYTKTYLDEKIGDSINYLHLLEALLIEREGLGIER